MAYNAAVGIVPPAFAARTLVHGGFTVQLTTVAGKVGLINVVVSAGLGCSNPDCPPGGHGAWSVVISTENAVRFVAAFDRVHLQNAPIVQAILDTGEKVAGPGSGGNVVNKQGSVASWGPPTQAGVNRMRWLAYTRQAYYDAMNAQGVNPGQYGLVTKKCCSVPKKMFDMLVFTLMFPATVVRGSTYQQRFKLEEGHR